jgi:hypothetical protein
LLKWALDGMTLASAICRKPSSAVYLDTTALHFDHHSSYFGVNSDHVGLAIAFAAVADRLPRDAMKDDPWVRQPP